MKRHAVIFALIFLGGLTATLAVLWRPALRWTAQRIVVPQLEAQLNADITLGDLSFSLFPPRVVVENLRMEIEKGPLRFVGAKRISVSPGAGPIFLGKIVIEHVEVNEPYLHIVPNVQGKYATDESYDLDSSLPSLQDLVRFEIHGFEVRDASLRVELPGEGLQIQIGSGNAQYTGRGQEERWAWEGDGILFHEGRSFRMDQVAIVAIRKGNRVWLEKFGIEGAGANVQLQGQAYPNPKLHLSAQASLNPLENALAELEMLSRPLNLAGKISVSSDISGSWNTPKLKGDLAYDQVTLRKRSFGHGKFSFSARKDRLSQLKGKIFLPDATFDLNVSHLAPGRVGEFSLKAEKASYKTVRTVSHPSSTAALDGWVDVDMDGKLGILPFSMSANYRIRSDRLMLNVGKEMSPYLPFEFKKVDIKGKLGWSQSRNFFLDEGELNLAGGKGSFQFDFPAPGKAKGVWQAELENVGDVFPEEDPLSGLGRVSGGLDVNGDVFSARLNLSISPLRYGNRSPKRLEGEVEFYEKGTRLKQFRLFSEKGSLKLDGNLRDGAEGPIDLSLAWADFDLGWLADIGRRRYGFLRSIEGVSSGSLLLVGTAMHPEGRLSIQGNPVSWMTEDFRDLDLILNFSKEDWFVEKAQLDWEGGKVEAKGSVGPVVFRDFEAEIDSLPLSLLNVPTAVSSFVNRVSGKVLLKEALEDPLFKTELTVFDVNDEVVRRGDCEVKTQGPLSQLNWALIYKESEITAEGRVNLLDGSMLEGRGAFKQFSMTPFWQNVSSQISGDWKFLGNLQKRTSWKGEVGVHEMKISQGDWFVESTHPVKIEIKNGTLSLPSIQLEGPSTNLNANGQIDLQNRLAFSMKGSLALRVLSLLTSNVTRAEGKTEVSLDLAGTTNSPNFQGHLDVEGGMIQILDIPHAIENINLHATLNQKRVFVDAFEANLAEGKVRGKGSLQVSGLEESPNILMDFHLDRLFLRVPTWLPAELSGNLSLLGRLDRPTLQGDVLIHRATYREQWDWKSRILTLSSGRRIGRVFGSDEEKLRFNIRIRSEGDTVFVRNDIATATLRMDLRLTGSEVAYGLLGNIEVIDGEVLFLDNTFEITTGNVRFTSTENIATNVDVTARTRVLDTDIFLDIRSEGKNIQAFLSSQPVKDETNIVALLTLGVDSDELLQSGASDQSLSSSLLPTVLSGPIQSRLESGLKKAKIIDTFQFVPYFSESTKTTGLKMTVGKKVLPSLQLLYSTDLFEIGSENTVRVEQRLNRNFSMQGSLRDNRDEDENEYDLGVDVEFGFEF